MFNGKTDTYVIFDAGNRFYFTGIRTSFGCAVLTGGEKYFLTDSRYMLYATQTLRGFNVVETRSEKLFSDIGEVCKKLRSVTVGYEEDSLSVASFNALKIVLKGVKLKPAATEIAEARAVKTVKEIEAVSAAQGIAQQALENTLPLIKPGITEKELSAYLAFNVLSGGAERTSFDSIVAFGANAAKPHHSPTDKKLEKGEVVLMDFGAQYAGYCSDMTRTFSVGEPDKELVKAYGIVKSAQEYALKNIKEGMTGHEADSFAREFLTANGYEEQFNHSLGHGIGISVHESPRVGKNSDAVLKRNMIITVEPGVYIPDLGGIRIEDMAVINEDGVTNLTNFPKNLIL